MAGKALILAALLLLAAGSAAEARGPAGRYRLVGVQDAASELLIRPDGRFAYVLAYGALDEHAEGRWTLSGKTLRLTTLPKPIPPAFSAGPAGRTLEAPLTLRAVSPDGYGIGGVDFRIGFDAGPPVESYTQEDGWSLPPEETRAPRWVQLEVAIYGFASPRFPIDAATANKLTFILTPNDMGVPDFEGLELDVAADGLRMHRNGALLIYRRERLTASSPRRRRG
ncbi:MAG TPA: hypothetical protein VGD66_06385 [Allosphingosinicella sp.]|jgi:hypothetical protein